MKRLSAILLVATSLTAGAQTIVSSGFTWSPSLLTITAGETVTFTVTSNHHAREVSEATWNASGTTSNGGFDFLAGTHTVTFSTPGTYYYVCVPHVSMGMKGRIVVDPSTGMEENSPTTALRIFPNPAANELQMTGATPGQVLTLVDAQGREALRQVVNGSGPIDISGVQPGNYTVLLTSTSRTVVGRERLTIAR